MSIKGPLKKELSMDSILNLISAYDIYRYYFGDFKINGITTNHLRDDHSPSFIIGNKHGELSHWDFADEKWRGDCFSLVMQRFGVSLYESLKIIDRDFGLGLSSGIVTGEYKKITGEYKQPEITRKNTYIQVVTRKFTNEELTYWNQYCQDITDLRENEIYSIKTLYLNKQKFSLKDTELRFGYFYDGYWKIYRPHASKKEKWFPNNTPITKLDGKENIKDCNVAFINKSKKDMMVIKKVYACSAGVQNESFACFNQENLDYIRANSKSQILSFDSDAPGVKNSLQVTEMFGFGYCNVSKKYLLEGIKDWSDLAKLHGLKEVEKILKDKQII